MTKEELKALGLADDVVDKILADQGKNMVSKNQFNRKFDTIYDITYNDRRSK